MSHRRAISFTQISRPSLISDWEGASRPSPAEISSAGKLYGKMATSKRPFKTYSASSKDKVRYILEVDFGELEKNLEPIEILLVISALDHFFDPLADAMSRSLTKGHIQKQLESYQAESSEEKEVEKLLAELTGAGIGHTATYKLMRAIRLIGQQIPEGETRTDLEKLLRQTVNKSVSTSLGKRQGPSVVRDHVLVAAAYEKIHQTDAKRLHRHLRKCSKKNEPPSRAGWLPVEDAVWQKLEHYCVDGRYHKYSAIEPRHLACFIVAKIFIPEIHLAKRELPIYGETIYRHVYQGRRMSSRKR